MIRLQARLPEAPGPRLEELAGSLLAEAGPDLALRLPELLAQGSVWVGRQRVRNPDSRPWAPVGAAFPDQALQIFVPDKPVRPFVWDEALRHYEDADLLAVRKPPNLNSVPTPFSDQDCLLAGVRAYLRAQAARESPGLESAAGFDPRGEAPPSAYLCEAVHRLDLPTQGLMLFPKHKEAERALHALFAARRLRKVYLLHQPAEAGPGDPPHPALRPAQGTWRDPVAWRGPERPARSWFKRLGAGPAYPWAGGFAPVGLTPAPEGALPAATLAPAVDGYWTAASPLTGRTHQLRLHARLHGDPITGDVTYGPWHAPALLQLAAVAYRFVHPFTGRPLELVWTPPHFPLY